MRVSSLSKGFYVPRDFITHAALLGQGCPHCQKFPTAASRRSLDRVSVPVCPTVLSDRTLIVALVSHYLTNQLISRGLLLERIAPFITTSADIVIVCGISTGFPVLFPTPGQITHVLLTRAPLYRGRSPFSCDLHVLGAPLTFALSQDQTLQLNLERAS